MTVPAPCAAAWGALPGRWRVEGEAPPGPCVYVVHHQNLLGPVAALALLPCEARPWVLAPFCEREACFSQYYGYTFTRRFGWPKPLARAAAAALAQVVPPLMQAFGAIPVYRGSARIRQTLAESQLALHLQQSLVVCPDLDYASPLAATGPVYQGFLHLGRDYQRTTGQPLPFVPALCSRQRKALVLGRPVYLPQGLPFARQKAAAGRQLVQAMNALARCCGDLAAQPTSQAGPVMPPS